MKLRKFVAPTTREALALVKESLGDDAVVLTTRESREGIEILAAAQNELSAEESKQASSPKPTAQAKTGDSKNSIVSSTADIIKERMEIQAKALEEKSNSSAVHVESGSEKTEFQSEIKEPKDLSEGLRRRIEKVSQSPIPTGIGDASKFDEQVRLMKEMLSIKEMLGEQMQMLTWRDTVHKNPVRAEIWELLKQSGFSPLFARKVVEKLDESFTSEQANAWLRKVLMKNIPCVEKGKDLVNTGGTFALVGPTGVGKTTTTAKIAARCVIKYGRESIGLITTDSFRIGAQDQLRIYGKILGVQVYTAQTLEDLRTLRQTLSRKHLVLIDTVGMAQRDKRISDQTQMLRDTDAKRILLLNGAAQPENLDDVALHYKKGGLDGSILSKLDEAVRLGGAIDIAIRHKLPIHYLATGQQVPEDLYSCNSAVLINRALNSKASTAFDVNQQEKAWMEVSSHKVG